MPTDSKSTPSRRYLDASTLSTSSSLAPACRKSSLAAIWTFQSGIFRAQAILLTLMLVIAAIEAKITTMASHRGCPYRAGHSISDLKQLLFVDESSLEVDVAMVSNGKEEEK